MTFARAAGHRRSPRKTGAIDSRYTPFRLRIRHSGIHGFGVFAQAAIPKGRDVIEYTGERVSRVEARRRFVRAWQTRERRIYLAWLNTYWAIDGSCGGSGAELINHCCEPNLRWNLARGRLFFASRRRIGQGEELTLDYAFRKDGPKIPCRCGAATCRGTINLK